MKRKLIIFGAGDIAEIAAYYFDNQSEYDVVSHTVDGEFLTGEKFGRRPVCAFEEIAERFPASEHDMFVALSYTKLNALRKDKYQAAKSMGYKLASFVSEKASVLNGNQIGDNCFIFEDNTIQPFCTIGNNVTLWSGNHIGHHSVIHDHVFISSHVVVSGGVEIGEQSFIGVNATLRDHIKVGERCVIGAGALLLSDAEAEGVYLGKETERSRVPSSRLRGI